MMKLLSSLSSFPLRLSSILLAIRAADSCYGFFAGSHIDLEITVTASHMFVLCHSNNNYIVFLLAFPINAIVQCYDSVL